MPSLPLTPPWTYKLLMSLRLMLLSRSRSHEDDGIWCASGSDVMLVLAVLSLTVLSFAVSLLYEARENTPGTPHRATSGARKEAWGGGGGGGGGIVGKVVGADSGAGNSELAVPGASMAASQPEVEFVLRVCGCCLSCE